MRLTGGGHFVVGLGQNSANRRSCLDIPRTSPRPLVNSMIMRAKQLEHGLYLCWSGYVEDAEDAGKASQHSQPGIEA